MLAVTGGKGGTGKTTTTLGLAHAVARAGDEALAVDADRDLPDLAALAGLNRDRSGEVQTVEPGVRVMTPPDGVDEDAERRGELRAGADARFRGVEATVAANPHADTVAETLRRVGADEDTATRVLVDCPAGAGPDAAAPLRVADAALVATEPCAAALRDAAKAAAMARALSVTVAGAVLVRARFEPPGVAEFLGCPVLGCVPTADGAPLADRRVRAAYDALAGELWADLGTGGVAASFAE